MDKHVDSNQTEEEKKADGRAQARNKRISEKLA